MKKRDISAMILLLFALLYSVYPSYGAESDAPEYRVIVEMDVKVTMRDGIRLSANIFRPDHPGEFPALLMRTPYSNGGVKNPEGRSLAKRGYAVVIQDTRGRFESEGVFDAMQPEKLDGYDTQQWVGQQPWCNGKIGTFGGSYVGFTQWIPASLAGPHLVTMFPLVTFADLHDLVYHGGAFRLRLLGMWSIGMTAPYEFNTAEAIKKLDDIHSYLPLMEQDTQVGWRIPFLRDWLAHPEHDLYWDRTSIKDGYMKINASVYNLGGWFDLVLKGTLDNFINMTAANIDPQIRKKQKLLIGPWAHAITPDGKVGDLDFGKDALINLPEIQFRWFDSQLKGIDNGIMEEAPVKIFVMGENKWRKEQEWPLARTQYRNYYFHSGGKANTLTGNGTLSGDLPKNEPPDRYTYDPANPVPSAVGNKLFDPFTDGPRNHLEIEKRQDVLVYSTPPLKSPIEVTGPVSAVIYASSSAPNTDFTAKLLDVFPDGNAYRMCDGIIRASFRDPLSAPSNIKPDSVYRYEIDLWATSNVFQKGHRIRVEISSSNFPHFDRNLNTGRNFATDSTYVTARQTIYHNRDYPSHIVLPVIE